MAASTHTIREHFSEAQQVLHEFLERDENFEAIGRVGKIMVGAINAGGKIISCGNGGSLCDAMHFAEELTGRFREDRPALPAMAISDPSHLACVGNDLGFKHVFSRFLEGMGNKGDVLLAISTSGNSENVVLAAETARKKGMKVAALTGKNGGRLASICDEEIRAPHTGYADRIQEIHIKVIHSLIDYIERNS